MYIGCNDVIARADLSGESITSFVTSDVPMPNGFGLDQAGELLE